MVLGFLVWGMSSANLASAYQTWVVTYAHPDQRPIYIGLSNTMGAVVSLLAPILAGSIVQFLGYEPLFVVALGMTFAALFVALRSLNMPRVALATEAVEAAGGG